MTASPSPFEQLTVELINQARLNPSGEYERWVTNAPQRVQDAIDFFNVDLTILKEQFDALVPVAPVAWNEALGVSSAAYSQLMLDTDTQSHGLDGLGIGARLAASGYANWSGASENIFAFAEFAEHAHAGFFIDWGFTATGIQQPPGHRNTIMNPNRVEVGVGMVEGTGDGSGPGANPVGPMLVTHHFGNRFDYQAQITGVIFNDQNGDRFYTMGEGVAGATVSSGGVTSNAYASGGYNLQLPGGTHTVNFSSTLGNAAIEVTLGTQNIKVDMFGQGAFRSSVTAKLDTGGRELQLIGEQNIDGTGNAQANTLIGNIGNNILDGGAGTNILIGGPGNDTYLVRSSFDIVDEGFYFPDLAGSATDFDTIISHADFWWDLTSAGQRLIISEDIAGTFAISAMISGAFDAEIIGNSGNNIIFTSGGDNVVRPGGGIDSIALGTTPGFLGIDTIVLEKAAAGTMSWAVLYDFMPGTDKVDLSALGYSSFAEISPFGFEDGAGNSYFVLDDSTSILFFVGQELAALTGGDFIV